MNLLHNPSLRLRPLLLLSVLVLALTPTLAWAGEPLPPDHPLLQEAVSQGTATAAARITHRAPPAETVQGGLGGAPETTPGPVEATVEGFTAYAIPELPLIVQIPEEWELNTDVEDGYFGFRIPGQFSYSFFDALGQDDFPGLLGLTIFNTRADLLVSQMDESMRLEGVGTFATAQGVPGVKIVFAGQISGIDMSGGFYLLATARSVYGLVILSSEAAWPDIEAQMDLVAQNLIFTDEADTAIVQAGEEPLPYTSVDNGLALTLPPGWLLQETTDERIPLSIADADFLITGVVASPSQAKVDPEALASLRDALSAGSDLASEDLLDALDAVFTNSGTGFRSSDFSLDPDLLTVHPGESPTVRFGGEGNFDSFTMPVLFYLDVRADTMVLGLFLGEGAALEAADETLLAIVRSVRVVSE